MKKWMILVFPVLLSILLLQQVLAGEQSGQKLHQQYCQSCHQDNIYQRDNRRVHSLAQLKRQISMCVHNLDIQIFPDEEKALVAYLNTHYYHF